MGEHELQRLIAEFLRPLLERWFASRSEVVHAGADQFFYWVEGDPTQRIAPDVYVVPRVAQTPPVASWKLWEMSARPSFALEVVGQDIDKDYNDNPVLYAQLGVQELVLFDPHATSRSRRRLRWQVFRRVKGRGLVRVEVSNGDRVRSKSLGCWLRESEHRGHPVLRLATDDEGETLFPTEAEEERAAKEAERAAKEAERAAKEAERAAKEEALAAVAEGLAARERAEAENALLRAELASLRAKG
jgi:Uma2 family endonuclease